MASAKAKRANFPRKCDYTKAFQKDYELLSSFAPRSIEAVEKLMAEKSLLNNYKLPPLKSDVKKAF